LREIEDLKVDVAGMKGLRRVLTGEVKVAHFTISNDGSMEWDTRTASSPWTPVEGEDDPIIASGTGKLPRLWGTDG
jgi:hypothetical protein